MRIVITLRSLRKNTKDLLSSLTLTLVFPSFFQQLFVASPLLVLNKPIMDCDKATFSICFNNNTVEIDTVCEGSDTKFNVHLPQGDLLIEMDWSAENDVQCWHEVGKGETELATQLGELIERCPRS